MTWGRKVVSELETETETKANKRKRGSQPSESYRKYYSHTIHLVFLYIFAFVNV